MSRKHFPERTETDFARQPKGLRGKAAHVIAEALEQRWLLSGNTPNIGVNIRRLGYDSGDQLFADAMKEPNFWSANLASPADVSTRTPIDANGWPTTDAGIEIVQTTSDDGGTYALSFTGQGTVAPIATEPGVVVSALSYNASSNVTTGQVIVPAGGQELMLDFTNTRRLPTDSTATGVTNVQLMRPSAPDSSIPYSTNTVFSTPILNLLSNFSTIRYMDYSLTNNNPQVNWSDRTLPSQVQTNGKGGSWEYAVALANAAGKDMWINVPEMATNQYITDLAQLINYGSDGVNPYTGPQGSAVSASNPNPVPANGPVWAGLNSNLHVYVEYSNEVWNNSFAQNAQNTSAAMAEVNAGNSPLNYDGSTSTAVWAARRTAERTVITSNLFRAVFGDSRMISQIRPVYQWQYSNLNDTAAFAMTFLNNYYNNGDGIQHVAFAHPANYYLWGGGGGWYGGVNNPSGTGDVTVPSANFSAPAVSGFSTDPTGSTWSFSGAAGITANGSTLGNPASTSGTQAAWLQTGGSFSELVNFTGGLADLTFSAAATGSQSFAVSIDDTDYSSAWTLAGAYSAQRTAVFDAGVSAGAHLVTFTATGGSGSAFISNVVAETANGMYKNGIQDITATSRSEADWATAFGLHVVSYEGGFNFGSGNVGTPLQIAANQDPRAEQAAIAQMDEFYAAGGELGMYYDTTNHIWALTLDINNQNTPKIDAVQSVLDAPQVPLNVGVTLPTSAGQSITIASALAAGAGAPGLYAFYAPVAGNYSVTLSGKQSGAASERFLLDGNYIDGSTTLPTTMTGNSSPLNFTVTTPGLHALFLVVSGTISPNNPAGSITVTAGSAVQPQSPTISGTVFNDVNGDGVQDNGETGIAGVRVYEDPNYNHAWDSASEQGVLTDASGNYTFTNLPADPEILRIVLPSSAQQTFPANGVGQYVGKNLTQSLSGINFGVSLPVVRQTGNISGSVFNDANQDGVQDNGETGLAGIVMYVDVGNTGTFSGSDPQAVTDANGNYTFTGIVAGPAIVRPILLPGYSQTTPTNNAGISVTVVADQTVAAGQSVGIYQLPGPAAGSISGIVFNDSNGDGNQNNGEQGLANVIVYQDPNYNHKLDPGEQFVTTDANGDFIFTNPPADPEILRVILPTGAQQTLPTGGAGIYVGRPNGQTIDFLSFGIHVPTGGGTTGSITGSVFNDLNGDHAKASTEPGLAGQTVFIDANNDGILDGADPTAITNSSGSFTFNGLSAGSYTVFVSPAAGYRQTLPVSGGTHVTVSAGGTASAGTFGVTTTAYVGGTLFNDLNGNGIQNAGEAALSGWTVYVDLNNDGKRESNEATAVTTTTSAGYWYFRAVAPGTYTIRAVPPTGWTLTHAYTVTLAGGANIVNGLIGAKKS